MRQFVERPVRVPAPAEDRRTAYCIRDDDYRSVETYEECEDYFMPPTLCASRGPPPRQTATFGTVGPALSRRVPPALPPHHTPAPVGYMSLVELQTFTGCWKLDEPLAGRTGVSLKQLQDSNPIKVGLKTKFRCLVKVNAQ